MTLSRSSDFSPNTSRPFAFWAYRRAFARRSLHAEHPMRSPGVTPCSSAPCRPHTPWSEGWMDNAFVAIVPTRPCPPLWPTGSSSGWLPSIAARSFSSCPSDSTSRWTPCPPRPPAPRPARRYPRLRIWRPPSERQWDSNPPEPVAAQRTLCAPPTPTAASPYQQRRGSRPLAAMGLPCCAMLCADAPRPVPR